MATTPAIRATSARVAGLFVVEGFVFKRLALSVEVIYFFVLSSRLGLS
jgi:hypothetical protein